ncbi:18309_t:CDS:2, partial [Gigaspora rosea]
QACLKGHTLNVSDVCWSNDSRSVLSGAYDQTCKFWDVETNNNIFVSGSSRKVLAIIDIRKPESVLSFKDDGMINSLYVCRNGQNIITGDSLGYVKTWDIRTGSAFQSFPNEKTKKPVSHIAVSKSLDGEEPRHMAVNSYDNHQYSIAQRTQTKDIYDEPKQIDSVDNVFYEKDKSLEESLLLATGSADPYAYLFNVGGPERTGELLQRLEGHTDFVYAVDFHPFEPILASCSADFTIKIWVPNAR